MLLFNSDIDIRKHAFEIKINELQNSNSILKKRESEIVFDLTNLNLQYSKLKSENESLKESILDQQNSIHVLEGKLAQKDELLNKQASIAAMIRNLSKDFQNSGMNGD